jgi:MerR family copper efflux transcriptional regulator
MPDTELHQIGVVADTVGLSLRTIRHYEEVGLVVPSGRSHGGFRLYTDDDIDRLVQVKAMKPFGFSLDEIGEVLELRRAARAQTLTTDTTAELVSYVARATAKCDDQQRQLADARAYLSELAGGLGSAPHGHRAGHTNDSGPS